MNSTIQRCKSFRRPTPQRLLSAFALLLTFAAVGVQAQTRLDLPRPSPRATVMQRVGVTDIAITYGRPAVKNRKIFAADTSTGDKPVVKFGDVWRTGANEATSISFNDPVTINGQPLAAGRYSLHTIPGAGEWTIIFNKTADQWGSYQYKADEDALRVKARPETIAKREVMTIGFPNVTETSAEVAIEWDTVRVPFTVGVEVNQRALTAARTAVASAKPDDFATPYQAAAFAFERDLAADEAMTWIDKSISASERYQNLALKARMMRKAGNTAEARRLAERAITIGRAAKPQPADTSAMEKLLAELKTQS